MFWDNEGPTQRTCRPILGSQSRPALERAKGLTRPTELRYDRPHECLTHSTTAPKQPVTGAIDVDSSDSMQSIRLRKKCLERVNLFWRQLAKALLIGCCKDGHRAMVNRVVVGDARGVLTAIAGPRWAARQSRQWHQPVQSRGPACPSAKASQLRRRAQYRVQQPTQDIRVI